MAAISPAWDSSLVAVQTDRRRTACRSPAQDTAQNTPVGASFGEDSPCQPGNAISEVPRHRLTHEHPHEVQGTGNSPNPHEVQRTGNVLHTRMDAQSMRDAAERQLLLGTHHKLPRLLVVRHPLRRPPAAAIGRHGGRGRPGRRLRGTHKLPLVALLLLLEVVPLLGREAVGAQRHLGGGAGAGARHAEEDAGGQRERDAAQRDDHLRAGVKRPDQATAPHAAPQLAAPGVAIRHRMPQSPQ